MSAMDLPAEDLPPELPGDAADINMDDMGNEIFEGEGEEMDPLPINISTVEMQELTDTGETVVVVELEEDLVPVRLVVQDVQNDELPPAEGPEGAEGTRELTGLTAEDLQIGEPQEGGPDGGLGMDEAGAL